MTTTKVFATGRNQAVRIPKEYRLDVNEVVISKIGDALLLTPLNKAKSLFLDGLREFTPDYMNDRQDNAPWTERENL